MDEVVTKGEPVVITKRAGKMAVLVSYEEFAALKATAEGKVKTRLRKALQTVSVEDVSTHAEHCFCFLRDNDPSSGS